MIVPSPDGAKTHLNSACTMVSVASVRNVVVSGLSAFWVGLVKKRIFYNSFNSHPFVLSLSEAKLAKGQRRAQRLQSIAPTNVPSNPLVRIYCVWTQQYRVSLDMLRMSGVGGLGARTVSSMVSGTPPLPTPNRGIFTTIVPKTACPISIRLATVTAALSLRRHRAFTACDVTFPQMESHTRSPENSDQVSEIIV